MKIVIDIDENIAYHIINGSGDIPRNTVRSFYATIADAIKDGTPLPKGHEKLGDLDKIKKDIQNYHDDCATTSEYTRLGFETAIAVVEDADTIIEADKESGE